MNSRHRLLLVFSSMLNSIHCLLLTSSSSTDHLLIDNHLGFGRWQRRELTYSIVIYPDSRRHPRIPEKMLHLYVDRCLERAVRLWTPVIKVPFRRVSAAGDADIKLFFYTGQHDDNYPFDGVGGEVAHAFYPEEQRRGQIHIDDDEPWGPDGRNLEWTLAHELGHVLGIPHQQGPSLMQNGYRGYRNTPKLTSIDKRAASILYGTSMS